MIKFFESFDKAIERGVSWLLVFCVFGMLFLSVLSIVLRWFHTSLHWSEPLVRHLVFLSTFLGGVIATGRGTHIGIDIVGKYLESEKKEHLLKLISRIICITSVGTLVWLVKASYDFTVVELEFGKPVFWGIQSGYLVGIIPFGFGLLAVRFFNRLVLTFKKEESC